jgi:GlpG protein
MRRIGTVESSSLASRFCDYLVTLGIHATVDPAEGGVETKEFSIWVKDERRIEEAKAALTDFLRAPSDVRFQVSNDAAKQRAREAAENQRRLKNLQPSPIRRTGLASGTRPVVIITTIIICLIAGVATNFGRPRIRVTSDGRASLPQEFYRFDALKFVSTEDWRKTDDAFASIRKGEIWRLITPAILHGNIGHFAMNMLSLFVLGVAIERIQGRLVIALLLIVTALAGTVVQAVWPELYGGGPNAVGASGAAFGLLGYIWVRPFYHSDLPIAIPPSGLILAMMFLLLGVAGVIQGIANGAHVGGLVAGMILATVLPSRSKGGSR